jgi:quercetin dioxygenase-like cupin family protein
MFAMKRLYLLTAVLFAGLAIAAFGAAQTGAQEGQPLELSCVTGVMVQPIGQAMPDDAEGQALVVMRLTIAPGGGFAAHTHPGTLIVAIESGTFELTQLDDMEMVVMRAATGATPGTSETMTRGTPMSLNPGDSFVEPEGMVHMASNQGSEPTVVLVTGLVDPNQPFVQCIEGTPTA